MEKPLMMSDKEWANVMEAHKEIVNVLEKHNVPQGIAVRILIDIERSIDAGMTRTVLVKKGVV